MQTKNKNNISPKSPSQAFGALISKHFKMALARNRPAIHQNRIAVRYSPESVKNMKEAHAHDQKQNRSSYNKILLTKVKNYESKQN